MSQNKPERSTPAPSRAEAPSGQPQYPLGVHDRGLHAASGRTLPEINLSAATAGELSAEDLKIGPETLRAQAEVARAAGFRELAANLLRAAELTAVPNEELLRMYERLRPGRATYAELVEIATTLVEQYGAHETAIFVREAAEVYRSRNLVRRA
jgi:propanediol dehydratase small subunit